MKKPEKNTKSDNHKYKIEIDNREVVPQVRNEKKEKLRISGLVCRKRLIGAFLISISVCEFKTWTRPSPVGWCRSWGNLNPVRRAGFGTKPDARGSGIL